MKNFGLILLLGLFQVSCDDNRVDYSAIFPFFEKLVQGYYQCNYEFPDDTDTFVDFLENRRSKVDSCVIREYDLLMDNLKQEKSRIRFQVDELDLFDERLTVIVGHDTLFQLHNDNRFPCLGNMMDSFGKCYFRFPSSADELIAHCEALLKSPSCHCDLPCWAVTMKYLKKAKDKLTWEGDDNRILVTWNTDTLLAQQNENKCELLSWIWPIDVPTQFYDSDGFVIFDTDSIIQLKSDFKKRLMQLGCSIGVETKEFHLMQYTKKDGLRRFCANDEGLDSKWQESLLEYVAGFASNYYIDGVIFTTKNFQIEDQ